jgi:hypothetical protein
VPSTRCGEAQQLGEGTASQGLWVLPNANVAEVSADGQGGDADHTGPAISRASRACSIPDSSPIAIASSKASNARVAAASRAGCSRLTVSPPNITW